MKINFTSASILVAIMLFPDHSIASISCEDELRRCNDGMVMTISIDEETILEWVDDPEIPHHEWYDMIDRQNCCEYSPHPTITLENVETTVIKGSVSFEMEATSFFNLVLPSGFELDGLLIKANGSTEVTVQQSASDEIVVPMCKRVEALWGPAYKRTHSTFEGQKTCGVYYPPAGPGGMPYFEECGAFLDICHESYKLLYDPTYLQFDVPVSPFSGSCGSTTPNPCADPLNPQCGQ